MNLLSLTEFEANSSQAVTIKVSDWQTTPAPPAQPAERLYSRCVSLDSANWPHYKDGETFFAVCLQPTLKENRQRKVLSQNDWWINQ